MRKWAKYGRKYRRQWEEEAWAKGLYFVLLLSFSIRYKRFNDLRLANIQ
jgi:hypothetical protein